MTPTTSRTRRLARSLLVLALLLTASGRAWGYVEAPMSLGAVIQQSTHVMLMRVERVDKEKNVIFYRKIRDIKGKHPTDLIKHNIARVGFHPREWQYPMEWAEVGKTAVFMHNGGASETCIGTYWYQAYASGEWWNMSHGEPFLLRSFAGKPEKLAAAVTAVLAEQEVIVPCMVDGNKEDLHLRRAKMHRLRVSLKLQDYNPKRDFAGWGGGEDFERLAGMPGFTHISLLPRVDPEAQALACVDIDGDGRPDLCLAGAGKIVLVQNGGESLNEVTLPGAAGCRAAVWADYNGDGTPDLLLATLTGPRLYTNLAGSFRDDTHLLPVEPCYNLTAAAWIDQDGDGRPDILLGNGFHGLRLYRNRASLAEIHRHIASLNDDDLDVSDRAARELEKVGMLAEPMLNQALVGKPAPEARRRIDRLLHALALAKVPHPPASSPAAAGEGGTLGRWFTDVSDEAGLGGAGIGSTSKGDTLTVADVNGDGRPDFLYGAGTGLLVVNTPRGFKEVKDSGISYKPGKVGPIFGDCNSAGRLDLFVPQNGTCKLFQNDGAGHFTDVTASSGDLCKPIGQATCAAWGDFHNDGRLHLVVGCLRGPNRFFRNLGGGKFKDETETLGLNRRIFNTQAVCLVDLNHDGALDLVFNNEGQESAVLLGNKERVAALTPVTLELAGTSGIIGSRVTIIDKDGRDRGVQYICGGEGRGGQRPLHARFALQPGNYRVEVRYSSGVTHVQEIKIASAPMRRVVGER